MGSFITLVKRSFQSFGSDKCAALAAAIAYYTVFALFPLALVAVSVGGFFLGDAAARQQVIDGITSVIALGPDGQEGLEKTLAGVSRAKGWLGLVGVLTAAWSASGLFGAIRSALDSVWDVDRPLPLLRAKARDLLLLGGFGILLFVATASTGVLQGARQAGAGWLGPLRDLAGPGFWLLTFFAPLVITFAAFMVLYRVAPHARLAWRDVWPAALLATLFFEFGKNLLTYYIKNLGNFNVLAGSLGAAILLLVFVYYTSQVILFAAELTKHRVLVKEGVLPATDPKVDKPQVPLSQQVKGTLARLWTVEKPHHDPELPYEPARLDPATNRPTNTREEVLVKQQEARERAGQDAPAAQSDGRRAAAEGKSGTAAGARLTGTIVRLRVPRHAGEQLAVQTGTEVHPLTIAPDVPVIREGQKASADDLQPGDWVSVRTTATGQAQRIYAQSQADRKQGGVNWWHLSGTLLGVALAAVTTLRRRPAAGPRGRTEADAAATASKAKQGIAILERRRSR